MDGVLRAARPSGAGRTPSTSAASPTLSHDARHAPRASAILPISAARSRATADACGRSTSTPSSHSLALAPSLRSPSRSQVAAVRRRSRVQGAARTAHPGLGHIAQGPREDPYGVEGLVGRAGRSSSTALVMASVAVRGSSRGGTTRRGAPRSAGTAAVRPLRRGTPAACGTAWTPARRRGAPHRDDDRRRSVRARSTPVLVRGSNARRVSASRARSTSRSGRWRASATARKVTQEGGRPVAREDRAERGEVERRRRVAMRLVHAFGVLPHAGDRVGRDQPGEVGAEHAAQDLRRSGARDATREASRSGGRRRRTAVRVGRRHRAQRGRSVTWDGGLARISKACDAPGTSTR